VRSLCETDTGNTLEHAMKIVLGPSAVHGLYDALHNIGELCRVKKRYTKGIAALTIVLAKLRAAILQQTTAKSAHHNLGCFEYKVLVMLLKKYSASLYMPYSVLIVKKNSICKKSNTYCYKRSDTIPLQNDI